MKNFLIGFLAAAVLLLTTAWDTNKSGATKGVLRDATTDGVKSLGMAPTFLYLSHVGGDGVTPVTVTINSAKYNTGTTGDSTVTLLNDSFKDNFPRNQPATISIGGLTSNGGILVWQCSN